MLHVTLRFLFIMAALALFQGMHAVPAGIVPNDNDTPDAAPDATHITSSHGTAMEPASLLGRHYTLVNKRQALFGDPLNSLGIPPLGPSTQQSPNPRQQDSNSTPRSARKKTKTPKNMEERPKPPPVPRGVLDAMMPSLPIPGLSSKPPAMRPGRAAPAPDAPPAMTQSVPRDLLPVPEVPLRRRELSDVNFVSRVEPAPPAPPPPPPPPPPVPPGAYPPPYQTIATPTAAADPPTPKGTKKNQSKGKGKEGKDKKADKNKS
ncbi:hypothetical protein EUX98_g2306 [Antrodiella citrinella]|uniref:WH2 domain-containing protein n=1 Tax=Antrodiella citrinella TaxID=2447956 RepID=A0A4S4MZA4_9APHY|nr:hypothetical protein EUX98_g2306 [Antrodiella citrinella]